MGTNQHIRYKTVELLEKISENNLSVIKIEYKDCWVEVVDKFIFIKIHNGEGNSFTTRIHKLDLITAIKTDH
jgi:23S rRNA-/tRNA-specific pseudouridylate synthase